MKDYFSHDYNSRNDTKLVRAGMKFGLCQAIGAYWCIVEMLYEEGGYLPLTEYERITFELRCSNELITYLINDSELFENDGEMFWSNTAIERLKMRAAKSDKARKSIETRWAKKCNTNVSKTNNERNTSKEKESENESKEKECINTPLSPAIAPTPSPKNYKKATMSEIIKTFDRVNKTSSDFEDFAGDYALTAIGFYELFDNNIKAAGGKATVLQKAKGTWIDDIRQICEKDGYNLNDLREAYTFLTHDLFWQKNILSAQTLRKQMDKLKMAMKSEKEKSERTAQKTGVKVGDPRFCTDWSKSNEEYHLGF